MKNASQWVPTKAQYYRGRWRASRNTSEVGIGSRAFGDWTIAAYEDAIRTYAQGTLADLGCGKAPYFGIYRDLVSETIAIDWPSSPHESQHVEIFCDLNESIDLPNDRVDTVLCTDVLEHIFRPTQLWGEISRILRPGGVAIIATPFLYWVHEAPHDYHRYTNFALERYAQEAGLSVLDTKIIGGLPHVLTDTLCKALAKAGIFAEFVRFLSASLLVIPPIRTLSVRSAPKFPLAYLMVASKSPR